MSINELLRMIRDSAAEGLDPEDDSYPPEDALAEIREFIEAYDKKGGE